MRFLIINKDKLINTIEAENTDEARKHKDCKEGYLVVPIFDNQKFESGEIKIKSLLEQYESGLITKEEYEETINSNREVAYKENVDAKVIEFMRIFINNLDYKSLDEEQKRLLSEINTEVFSVKLKNPKSVI